jgi:hypothetical protein
MFKVITAHVPPPPGMASPLLWGTEQHVVDIFGPTIAEIRSVERPCVFRFTSAEEFVAFFRRWYGPTLTAFEALDRPGQAALASDLIDLVHRWDRHRDGGSVAIPSSYLESILTLR